MASRTISRGRRRSDAMGAPAEDASMAAQAASPPWVEVGRVLRAHGLRGGLLVQLYGNDPANLIRSARVRLSLGPREREFAQAKAVAAGSNRVRLRVEGIDERD